MILLSDPYFTETFSFEKDFFFVGEKTTANPCRFQSMFTKGLNFTSTLLETGLSTNLPLVTSWQDKTYYNITYPATEFEVVMLYHGNYTCKVDYMVGNSTITVESDVSRLVVKSKNHISHFFANCSSHYRFPDRQEISKARLMEIFRKRESFQQLVN